MREVARLRAEQAAREAYQREVAAREAARCAAEEEHLPSIGFNKCSPRVGVKTQDHVSGELDLGHAAWSEARSRRRCVFGRVLCDASVCVVAMRGC
jgi:hypothetical protein